MNTLYQFAATYAQRRPVALNVRIDPTTPRHLDHFTILIDKFDTLELYLWLSLRFPTQFIEKDRCLEQREFTLKLIKQSLVYSLRQRYSHSSEYRKNRLRVPAVPDVKEEIRAMAIEILNTIPKEDLCKYPNEDIEKDNKIHSFSDASSKSSILRSNVTTTAAPTLARLAGTGQFGQVKQVENSDGTVRKVFVRASSATASSTTTSSSSTSTTIAVSSDPQGKFSPAKTTKVVSPAKADSKVTTPAAGRKWMRPSQRKTANV